MPYLNTRTGHILVVDDQPANVRVVSALLARTGYEVSTAASGQAALDACKSRIPDLILLDLLMPGLDGFAVLRALKQDQALMRVPAICLTSMQDRELLVQAFESGAVDYVTKPFIAEELLARVSAQIGLKLARDRLERIAQERQNLVNLVAHDLKNPLTSILFATQILESGAIAQERTPRYLQMIQDSTQDALGYIKRYLESQAPNRQLALDAAAPLDATLEWLRRRYELQCESAGMQLHVVPGGAGLLARIDPLVVRQVSENLVTNALKYARSGGELRLSAAAAAPGFCQLVVEDRGPGISPTQERQLFKPFVRLATDDPLQGLSSGLGLSLARQIIADAGGELYHAPREGGGARFVIELPQVA